VTALEPGRYVCVSTPGFAGWLIRTVTRSPVNHAVIVTGPDEIIEATPSGVRRGTLSQYAGRYAVANTAEPMTQEQRIEVAAEAEKLLGDGYNWAADADIGLEDLGLRLRLLARFAGGGKLLMCSQTVVLCGKAAALDWLCGKPSPDQVAPGDLANRPGVEPVVLASEP
jgi:hypothetical protein